MQNVFVKPARPGLVVRDPETGKPLAAEGETKPKNGHWVRRIKAGDVTVAAAPEKEKPVAARKERVKTSDQL